MSNTPLDTPPRVGLFVTCLVNLMRPSVGLATASLLERAGCEVIVPPQQTCCGQPAYNGGDKPSAKKLALHTMSLFKTCDYVVVPSGSCASILKHHYPNLFDMGTPDHIAANNFAQRVFEITQFLTTIPNFAPAPNSFKGRATYHDACSGLRELGIKSQPRQLLANIEGLDLVEAKTCESCCGFGGAFCAKYPGISDAIRTEKISSLIEAGPDVLLSGDLGCLLHMAPKLRSEQRPIPCRHIVEVLADDLTTPPIEAGPLQP